MVDSIGQYCFSLSYQHKYGKFCEYENICEQLFGQKG